MIWWRELAKLKRICLLIESIFCVFIKSLSILLKMIHFQKDRFTTTNQALRPYFLIGKFNCLLVTLAICLVFWKLVNLLLKARVNFVLKKLALFPELACKSPANLVRSLLLRIVKFLAIFFLTNLILASFVALPDEAFEFLKVLS